MKNYFADTLYYIALLSRTDNLHKKALEWAARPGIRMTTTAWVITELADGFSAQESRKRLHQTLETMRNDIFLTILPTTQDLFEAGLQLHADRSDKSWSLNRLHFVCRHGEEFTN